MEKHARLSPSNHRWVHCPGSIRECEPYPNISGSAAKDGTGSHLLLELCLNTKTHSANHVGCTIGKGHHDQPAGWKINGERCGRVQIALDYIERRKESLAQTFKNGDVLILTESQSNPGKYAGRTDWYGTADVTILVKVNGKTVFVEVVDYKDGQNKVDVRNNPQLIAYLAGKTLEQEETGADIQQCRSTIVQPKMPSPISFWDYSRADLDIEYQKLVVAAQRTDDPDAPLIASEDMTGHCRWCPHSGNCVALQNQKLRKVVNAFMKDKSALKFLKNVGENITEIKDSVLVEMLESRALIEEMLTLIEKEAEIRLKNGVNLPGYKLLPGNSKKVWKDESKLVSQLRLLGVSEESLYDKSLISPAQFLKREEFKNVPFDNLIDVVPGNLKVKKVKQDDFSDLIFEPVEPKKYSLL